MLYHIYHIIYRIIHHIIYHIFIVSYIIYIISCIVLYIIYISYHISYFISYHIYIFRIIESPECPCGGGDQTVDHLLYDRTILQNKRESLIAKVSRQDNWQANKSHLANKYLKYFLQFTNTIDFTKL
jgi:hypothetical protein